MSKDTGKVKHQIKLEISSTIANICKSYLNNDLISISDLKGILESDELQLIKLAFLTNYEETTDEDYTEIEEMGEAQHGQDIPDDC